MCQPLAALVRPMVYVLYNLYCFAKFNILNALVRRAAAAVSDRIETYPLHQHFNDVMHKLE